MAATGSGEAKFKSCVLWNMTCQTVLCLLLSMTRQTVLPTPEANHTNVSVKYSSTDDQSEPVGTRPATRSMLERDEPSQTKPSPNPDNTGTFVHCLTCSYVPMLLMRDDTVPSAILKKHSHVVSDLTWAVVLAVCPALRKQQLTKQNTRRIPVPSPPGCAAASVSTVLPAAMESWPVHRTCYLVPDLLFSTL